MSEPVPIVLVGIGGYGEVYLEALFGDERGSAAQLVAVADPEPKRCRFLDEIRSRGIPVYDSLDAIPESIASRLTIVSSSIHTHCALTCAALARGSHVLCEKPAAGTVEEVDRMIAASRETGLIVAIGFQWSFTRSILDLKHDLLAGHFGRPRRARTLTLWPRDHAYYARNDWTGRLRHACGGWVLDSPANNAMAHDLHNLLFLLGDAEDRSSVPVKVESETYRANAIETFDTAAVRVRTEKDEEILFLASHAIEADRHPRFEIECEAARIHYDGEFSPIVVDLADGTRREYDSPWSEHQICKLWTCLDAITSGGPVPCTAETARAHTLVVNGIHAAGGSHALPEARIRREEDRTWVPGLGEDLVRCFDEGRRPGELDLDWAGNAARLDLRDLPGFSS
jgi:predicted dehydrogenase